MTLRFQQRHSCELVLGNAAGEELVVGYDAAAQHYFLARSKAGLMGFSPKCTGRSTAPQLAAAPVPTPCCMSMRPCSKRLLTTA